VIQGARGCTPRHAQRLMSATDLPQYSGMRYTSLELLNGMLRHAADAPADVAEERCRIGKARA